MRIERRVAEEVAHGLPAPNGEILAWTRAPSAAVSFLPPIHTDYGGWLVDGECKRHENQRRTERPLLGS